MSGYVYAIEADNGLVKIGFTNDLTARLSHLRANNCLAVKPLGYARGTLEQEAELHGLLRNEHVRGEWFNKGRLVAHFLSRLAPWPERSEAPARTPRAFGAVDEIIQRFGGREELATRLGTSKDAVKQWILRNEIPGKWHVELLRLAELIGVSLAPLELAPTARQDAGPAPAFLIRKQVSA